MSEEKKGISVEISDIYNMAQHLEIALKRKVFKPDEVQKLFPSWNNIIKFCEEVKRKADIEELYKEDFEKAKPKVEEQV